MNTWIIILFLSWIVLLWIEKKASYNKGFHHGATAMSLHFKQQIEEAIKEKDRDG